MLGKREKCVHISYRSFGWGKERRAPRTTAPRSPISTRLSTFPPPPSSPQLHILDGCSTASLDLTDSRLLSSTYFTLKTYRQRRFLLGPSQKIVVDGPRESQLFSMCCFNQKGSLRCCIEGFYTVSPPTTTTDIKQTRAIKVYQAMYSSVGMAS